MISRETRESLGIVKLHILTFSTFPYSASLSDVSVYRNVTLIWFNQVLTVTSIQPSTSITVDREVHVRGKHSLHDSTFDSENFTTKHSRRPSIVMYRDPLVLDVSIGGSEEDR